MKQPLPRVSIIVLTYNQDNALGLIFNSLNNQTYRGAMEIIISDDGSKNKSVVNTLEMIRNSNIDAKYVWQKDERRRAAQARNNGISIASGDILIFLDGDIIPFPDLVEKHVARHKNNDKMIVAGARIWLGERPAKSFDHLSKIIPSKEASQREKTERKRRIEWMNSKNSWRVCFTANLSIKRSSLVRFDERFIGWGPEDAEFAFRLCNNHDYRPEYQDDINAYHLEEPIAVGNIFRKGKHEEIVEYIKSTFLYSDLCRELSLKDVFWSFPRIALNEEKNEWYIRKKTETIKCNLKDHVSFIRKWINENT